MSWRRDEFYAAAGQQCRALAAALTAAALVWWGMSLMEYAASHDVPGVLSRVAAWLSGAAVGARVIPWLLRVTEDGDW